MLSRPQRLLSGQDTWLSCLSSSQLPYWAQVLQFILSILRVGSKLNDIISHVLHWYKIEITCFPLLLKCLIRCIHKVVQTCSAASLLDASYFLFNSDRSSLPQTTTRRYPIQSTYSLQQTANSPFSICSSEKRD